MRKACIKKLQQQVDALSTKHSVLASENVVLQSRAGVLEDLLKQRNALVCVLERVNPDSMAAAISVTQQQAMDPETEQLLQQLPAQPMASALTTIDQELHMQIMALTPAKAVDFWVKAVQQVALLVHLYQRDPLPALPALSEAVVSCMRWQLALHIFNPRVAYALLDYNMLLGRHEPAPPDHWAKAAIAGKLTPQQLQSISMLLQLVKPRLQQLEQEKEALLDELASLPGGYEEEDLAAPGGDDCGRAHNVGSGASSSTTTSTSSGASIMAVMHRLREVRQRRQELTAALARNCSTWRVITQMRGQWMSTTCTAAQLATGILQAFPYMPHGAPILDSSNKLAANQQQQQQLLQEDQQAALN